MESLSLKNLPESSDYIASESAVKHNKGRWDFQFNNGRDMWNFSCTSSDGGRITDFSLNGVNTIITSKESPIFGSTFWTSPQNDWGYPPPPQIDTNSFEASFDKKSNRLILTGSPELNVLNVQIKKEFSIDTVNSAIDIKYSILNLLNRDVKFAPWEISRVKPEGLTFFPKGIDAPFNTEFPNLPYKVSNNAIWIDHSDAPFKNNKLFSTSDSNWIGYLFKNHLFLKIYETPQIHVPAPLEAKIEVYSNGHYFEIEQQGSYMTIPKNSRYDWRVKWLLRENPKNIANPLQRKSLYNFAQNIVNKIQI
ncbi:MAG: hypothetical protein JXR91_14280 [Deltaproteobacteria bacterium]|nr:hypothetical protein [Deltaproteobacteria bacterium]